MERLTVNKNTPEMGMYELAHNCCYAKDRKARYRDFEIDIDARDFARKLMVEYGHWKSCEKFGLDADNELIDDDIFDETMLENLMYDQKESIGLIALFYRNLWAMADLHGKLKEYEDLEEQGLLLKLPVNPEIHIYSIEYCCGKNSNNKMGMCYRGFCSDCENKSYYIKEVTAEAGCKICELGKTVFLTQAEAEKVLKRIK